MHAPCMASDQQSAAQRSVEAETPSPSSGEPYEKKARILGHPRKKCCRAVAPGPQRIKRPVIGIVGRSEPGRIFNIGEIWGKKTRISSVHKVKHVSHKVMLFSNSRYAFFFEIMLLSLPRFTRISGMWYLVAFGEIHLLTG